MAEAFSVVGQDNPGAVLTDLYTVPASKDFVGHLHIANIAATAKTCRVAISIAGATIANDHYILYDFSIPANDSLTIPISGLNATDKVRVYGEDTNVTFNLMGVEIT